MLRMFEPKPITIEMIEHIKNKVLTLNKHYSMSMNTTIESHLNNLGDFRFIKLRYKNRVVLQVTGKQCWYNVSKLPVEEKYNLYQLIDECGIVDTSFDEERANPIAFVLSYLAIGCLIVTQFYNSKIIAFAYLHAISSIILFISAPFYARKSELDNQAKTIVLSLIYFIALFLATPTSLIMHHYVFIKQKLRSAKIFSDFKNSELMSRLNEIKNKKTCQNVQTTDNTLEEDKAVNHSKNKKRNFNKIFLYFAFFIGLSVCYFFIFPHQLQLTIHYFKAHFGNASSALIMAQHFGKTPLDKAAQKKAFEWFKKSYDINNNPIALEKISEAHFKGEGTNQSYKKAFQGFYELSSSRNDEIANKYTIKAAEMIKNNLVDELEEDQTIMLYYFAYNLEKDVCWAYEIGKRYVAGSGPITVEKAMEARYWFDLAAREKHAGARRELDKLYKRRIIR